MSEYGNRYAAAHAIARSLPERIAWAAPDIAEALLRPEVREAVKTWLVSAATALASCAKSGNDSIQGSVRATPAPRKK